MKKLLSLLGALLLSATSATVVVSCKPNAKEDPGDNSQDTNILLEINQKAKSKIKDVLKNYLYFNSEQNPLLANLYNKVNDNKKDYVLTATNDHEYITFFNQVLQKVVTIVNNDLIQEYSNYYLNSVPIILDNNKFNARVNYIDLVEIKKQFSEANISDLQAVGVLFNSVITIQFKNLTLFTWIGDKFEITNNVPLYQNIQKLVSNGILNVFRKNIFDAIKAIILDKDTKYFKGLYDNFNIDYSKNNSVLSQKLQNYFNDVIKNKAELQPYQITFNDNVDVITTISTGFDDFKIDHNKAGVAFFKYLNSKNIFEITEANSANFVAYYQTEILPDFKIEDNNIILGQFKINLECFNVLGLKLVTNDYEQNNINILISNAGFTTKLNNFGNLIINYFEYINKGVMKKYLNDVVRSGNWFGWGYNRLSKQEIRSIIKPDGLRFSDFLKLDLLRFKEWLNKNEKLIEDFDLFSFGLLNNQNKLWYGKDNLDFNGCIYYDVSKKIILVFLLVQIV
ncbi:lipoprotein [Spiroplasma sp. SV19]|uniref:lipoprotein n=1 Tax=Spiroplasma sp. SV19 TaxID=2570468 RepID=UPI0024B65AFD|nr:lipoprotein [Spiroplasma sp. SV19]WHQ36704.1 hypothetical protein E7Y35_02175 [Spiroplasma sp. SV19]